MKGFNITSGRIQVTDPCYEGGTYSEPAKNGVWVARVDRESLDSWGARVSRILVHHEDWSPVSNTKKKRILVGVDSGQMGVFDSAKFEHDGDFYQRCCDATCSKKGYGYLPVGFVTSSGLGDGAYRGTIYKEDGKAVAVEIGFLTD